MKLAEWIDRAGITRAEFARRIAMSQGTVSLLCQGKHWPSQKAAGRIFEATNGEVQPTDFLPVAEAAG